MVNLGDMGQPGEARTVTSVRHHKQSVSAADKRYAEAWLLGLEAFLDVRSTMPAQYLKAFMLVALEEGLGVLEYAAKSGVSQSVMSRHLLDLGDRDRRGEQGFGLITQREDPLDLRKHIYTLTPKGQALLQRVVRSLKIVEG